MKDFGHTAVLGRKSGQSTSGKNLVSSRTLGLAKVDTWARRPMTVPKLGSEMRKLPLLARKFNFRQCFIIAARKFISF